MASSRLEVDLGAIERNLGVIRRVTTPEPDGSGKAPGHRVSVCAVLKQDGYGTGALRIGKRLAAAGVEMIAVYSLDEARAMAEGVPGVHILVLMPVYGVDRHDPLYRHMTAGRVHLAMHGLDQFGAVQEMAGRLGTQLPLHLQVDTGLSRGGAMPEEAAMLLERVVASPKVRLGGLMTHFASPCCDEAFTREQARIFRDFVETIRPTIKAAVERGGSAAARMNEQSPPLVHAANSCATFRSRGYHGSMVRVGQSVLGYVGDDVPEREPFEFRAQMESLEPSVRWVTGLAHVQEIPAGWPVGYGSTWRAPARADGRRTRIALIPVGYADGYPRSLGGRGQGGPGWVGFTGRMYEKRATGEGEVGEGTQAPIAYAPVVGRVSMDQLTVDVTDVPEELLKFGRSGAETLGPEVEIYSRDPGAKNYMPRAADCAGTITHDLLCRVSARVERVYRSPARVEPVPAREPAQAMRVGTVRAAVA